MQISLSKVPHRNFGQRQTFPKGAIALLAMTALSCLSLTACSSTIATHGHTLDEAQLAQIEPGRSSRNDVLQLLGSPSSLASFDEATWYYVSQRTEKVSFYQEELIAQDVITVTFNDDGVVRNVDRHGLEQTAAVDPVSRVTPTAGAKPSALKQIISNIGRFGSGGPSGFDPNR